MKITRRSFIHAGCVAAAITLTPNFLDTAEARYWRGGGAVAIPSSVTGNTVLNAGGVNLQANFIFKNLWKQAQMGVTDPSILLVMNADGYPTSNSFTGVINAINYFPSGYTGRYKFAWTGTAARTAFLGTTTTIYSGGGFVLSSFGNTIFSGTNGLIEFDFSTPCSAAASGTAGVIRLTVTDSGIPAYQNKVYLRNGEGGLPVAWYAFTVVDATHIELTGTTFTGNTTGGSVLYAPYSVSCQFNNQDAISGFSNVILVRSSAPYTGDLAAVQSGVLADQFNADYESFITSINSKILRWMDNSAINGTNVARDIYNTPTTAITFNSTFMIPNILISTGTFGGTANAITASSYPTMPGSWTAFESFQGTMSATVAPKAINGVSSGTGGVIRLSFATAHGYSNGQKILFSGYNGAINPGANGAGVWTITVVDTTHIELTTGVGGSTSVYPGAWSFGGNVYSATIDVGTRGAKLLIPYGSQTGLGSGTPYTLNSGDQATFTYDAVQDAVMCVNALMLQSIPLSYRVAFCNKVNKHYWHNFPLMYDNTSVANETAYIRDNLTNHCYFECSNEIWNQGFGQTQWQMIRQMSVGMNAFDNGLAGASFNGLFHRLMMGQAQTTWGGRTGFHPVLSTIAVGASNADVKKYLYEGFNLNGTSFPLYAAAGYSNYDTAPNRPIDYSLDISYAPYYNDIVLQTGGVDTAIVSATDVSLMTGAADSYALGTAPGIAAAYAWFDNGAKQGTVGTFAISSIAANTITMPTNNWAFLFSVGYQSICTIRNVGGSLPTGITANTAYFLLNVTSTTCQLATVAAPTTPISISGGSGTNYIGILGSATMLFWKTFLLPGHVSAAVLYGKNLINYENAYQSSTVTQSQCTSLSISTSYGGTPANLTATGGTVYTAMQAWKDSTSFKAVVLEQLNDQKNLANASSITMLPGWYDVAQANGGVANDPWSIIKTDLYGFPSVQLGRPVYYSSFDAIQQFNL